MRIQGDFRPPLTLFAGSVFLENAEAALGLWWTQSPAAAGLAKDPAARCVETQGHSRAVPPGATALPAATWPAFLGSHLAGEGPSLEQREHGPLWPGLLQRPGSAHGRLRAHVVSTAFRKPCLIGPIFCLHRSGSWRVCFPGLCLPEKCSFLRAGLALSESFGPKPGTQ